MAFHILDAGAVTSWGGTENTALISSGSAPSEFTLALESDDFPTTAFNPTVVFETGIAGLYSYTASIVTRLNPAQHGATGLVTHSSGYTAGVRSWSMDITCAEHDTTAYNATAPTAHTFIPGLVKWAGKYESLVDTATSLVQPGGSAASATFKILENGSNDQTLAGNIYVKRYDVRGKLGELCVVGADYMGTGTLTAAGTSGTGIGNPLFGAGAVAAPVAGSLVLTSSSGKTYTGSAFWTRVSIEHAVGGLITATIGVRFTGALTIA